jgi:thimet oligopeptidase
MTARRAELDLDGLLREGYDRFRRYEFVDGNRMYAAFTHLVGIRRTTTRISMTR